MADDQRHPVSEPVTPPAPEAPQLENGPAAERRETAGRLLRRTREAHGEDLGRIADDLRIRRAYLEAIERGAFDQLPGATYAVGFVRSYAAHLGLDDDEVVRRFKQEVAGLEGGQELRFPEPVNEGKLPGAAIILVSLALLVVAYGGWYVLSRSDTSLRGMVPEVPERLQALVNGNTRPDSGGDAPSQPASSAGDGSQSADTPDTATNGGAASETADASGSAGQTGSAAQTGGTATAADGSDSADTTGQAAGTETAAQSSDETAQSADETADTTTAAGGGASASTEGGDLMARRVPEKPAVVLTTAAADAGPDANAASAESGEGSQAVETATATGETAQDGAPAVPDAGSSGAGAAADAGAQAAGDAVAGSDAGGDGGTGQSPDATSRTASTTEQTASSTQGTGSSTDPTATDAQAGGGDTGASTGRQSAPQQSGGAASGTAYGAAPGEAAAVLRATADSWIQVRAPNGKVLISRVLKAGSRYRIPARDGLMLDTGNAGGLSVVINGEVVRKLGAAGEVRRNIPLSRTTLSSGG